MIDIHHILDLSQLTDDCVESEHTQWVTFIQLATPFKAINSQIVSVLVNQRTPTSFFFFFLNGIKVAQLKIVFGLMQYVFQHIPVPRCKIWEWGIQKHRKICCVWFSIVDWPRQQMKFVFSFSGTQRVSELERQISSKMYKTAQHKTKAMAQIQCNMIEAASNNQSGRYIIFFIRLQK